MAICFLESDDQTWSSLMFSANEREFAKLSGLSAFATSSLLGASSGSPPQSVTIIGIPVLAAFSAAPDCDSKCL